MNQRVNLQQLLPLLIAILMLGVLGVLVLRPGHLPAIRPAPVTSSSHENTPIAAAVVNYADRLSAGDLEGTLAYFDDSARTYLLGLPPGGFEMLSGKEQIRTMLEENVASHFKMEVEVLSVVDDVVTARTITWHDFTRELGVAPVEATGVYVIKDGKIVTEAWHVSEASAAKFKTALAGEIPAEAESEPAVVAPVSEMTVTFANGTCSYDGPLALQAGEIAVTVDVRDQDKEKFAVSYFTLAPGKDFTDLMASTIQLSPPEWADLFSLREVGPGEIAQFNMQVEQGPVYLVCWSKPPDLATGAIGPFTVAE